MFRSANQGVWLAGGMILLQSLFFGIGNPVTKIGLSALTPFYYIALRFLLGFVLLFLLFHKKIIPQMRKKQILPCLLVSVFTALTFILCTFSLRYTTATTAGFLIALPVIFTPFLARFITKTAINKLHIIPILCVVAGLYCLCGGWGQFTFGLGELFALLSSLAYALTFELSAKYLSDTSPFFLSTFQAGFTGIVCLILALVFEPFPNFAEVPLYGWGAVFYVAVFCTVIAYLFQNTALGRISSTYAALILCAEPVFTVIVSYFLLGERLTPTGMAGAVLVMASIVLASLLPPSPQKT